MAMLQHRLLLGAAVAAIATAVAKAAAPAAEAVAGTCEAAAGCAARRALGREAAADVAGFSVLQLERRSSPGRRQASEEDGLVFMHVPTNFGHSIELEALGQGADLGKVMESFQVGSTARETRFMEDAKGPDGRLWGMMDPHARALSHATGCDLFYTPSKYWPAGTAKEYFGGKKLFAVLRDPYDKMANEFRQQVQGIDAGFAGIWRQNVSKREGHMERESPTYLNWYSTCDVNSYLQAELKKVLEGDRFRDNCHLLPQAEYFEGAVNGAVTPIDNRGLPGSFDALMQAEGYSYRMTRMLHNWSCPNVSAFALNEETRRLIRKVYARDFELLCEHFGYCDDKELICMENVPLMCGSAPGAAETAAAAVPTPPEGA